MPESTVSVRKSLSRVRMFWAQHSPSNPISLVQEIEPGVTIADFCVKAVQAQRGRRVKKEEGNSTASDRTVLR
jgi:hypothetical protein